MDTSMKHFYLPIIFVCFFVYCAIDFGAKNDILYQHYVICNNETELIILKGTRGADTIFTEIIYPSENRTLYSFAIANNDTSIQVADFPFIFYCDSIRLYNSKDSLILSWPSNLGERKFAVYTIDSIYEFSSWWVWDFLFPKKKHCFSISTYRRNITISTTALIHPTPKIIINKIDPDSISITDSNGVIYYWRNDHDEINYGDSCNFKITSQEDTLSGYVIIGDTILNTTCNGENLKISNSLTNPNSVDSAENFHFRWKYSNSHSRTTQFQYHLYFKYMADTTKHGNLGSSGYFTNKDSLTFNLWEELPDSVILTKFVVMIYQGYFYANLSVPYFESNSMEIRSIISGGLTHRYPIKLRQ
jgi:hypothetical protein